MAGSVKPPSPDPNRTNAKLVHVNNGVNFVLQKYGELETRVQENVEQLWSNEDALKAGMDAAEFNLRAHQKVLNAFALEFERLVQHLNDEVFKTEHHLHIVELADVTLPAEAGDEALVVRRLNWPYYHEQVESELKAIAELDDRKDEDETAQPEEGIVDVPSEVSVEGVPPQDDIPAGASVFGG